MKRLAVYIILVAASIYIALIYRNEAFLNIFYGSLVIIIPLALLNIISICNMEIFINLPHDVVQAGRKIPVEIIIRNGWLLPTGRIETRIKSINSYSGRKEVTKFYGSAGGHSSIVLKCYYLAKKPGNMEFSIKGIWSCDYLGILKLPVLKYNKYKHPVIVMPELYEVPVYKENSLYGDVHEDEALQDNFIEPDIGESSGTRQYIPGDSFKNIHWKLSAKSGELMTRQRYNSVLCIPVFFICEGNIEGTNKKVSFIQAVLSISSSLVFNACPHYICWYDREKGDIIRYLVEQEKDLYKVMQGCTIIIQAKNNNDTDINLIRDVYKDKYHGQEAATYLAFNTNFELFVNNSKIAQYNYKSLKESLSSVEIQL